MDRRFIRTKENNGVLTIQFKDFIDSAFEEIKTLVSQGHTNLLIDFEGTRHLPSAFIADLVALWKMVRGLKGSVVLYTPQDSLYDQLLNFRMNQIFTIEKDLPVIS